MLVTFKQTRAFVSFQLGPESAAKTFDPVLARKFVLVTVVLQAIVVILSECTMQLTGDNHWQFIENSLFCVSSAVLLMLTWKNILQVLSQKD